MLLTLGFLSQLEYTAQFCKSQLAATYKKLHSQDFRQFSPAFSVCIFGNGFHAEAYCLWTACSRVPLRTKSIAHLAQVKITQKTKLSKSSKLVPC